MSAKYPLTAEQREALEASHTFRRIVELRLDPVRGRFDAGHLKEINRRIFQDLPGLGFDDVTPGEYRPPVPAGNDWIKVRSLETVGAISSVAYSLMDEAAQKRLDEVLAKADPAKLGKRALTRSLAKRSRPCARRRSISKPRFRTRTGATGRLRPPVLMFKASWMQARRAISVTIRKPGKRPLTQPRRTAIYNIEDVDLKLGFRELSFSEGDCTNLLIFTPISNHDRYWGLR